MAVLLTILIRVLLYLHIFSVAITTSKYFFTKYFTFNTLFEKVLVLCKFRYLVLMKFINSI